MNRATIFLGACLLTSASPALADDGSAGYDELASGSTNEVARFVQSRTHVLGQTVEPTMDLLVIFRAGAEHRPPGAAYLKIAQRIDCSSHAVKTTAYAAFGADGTAIADGKSLPPDIATFAAGPEIDSRWENVCRLKVGSPLPPVMISASDLPPHAADVPAAVALVRQQEADIEAATHLPEDGDYVDVVHSDDLRDAVMMIDHAHVEHDGSSLRLSWLFVPKPSLHQPESYLRARYAADCQQRTGARILVAAFDADNKLIKVQGANESRPLDQMGKTGEFLWQECMDGTWKGLFADSYPTFAAALAAARAKLKP